MSAVEETKRRIIVGVDGSESSIDALRSAARLAAALECPLEAISVWVYPPVFEADPPVQWELQEERAAHRRYRRRGRVRRRASRVVHGHDAARIPGAGAHRGKRWCRDARAGFPRPRRLHRNAPWLGEHRMRSPRAVPCSDRAAQFRPLIHGSTSRLNWATLRYVDSHNLVALEDRVTVSQGRLHSLLRANQAVAEQLDLGTVLRRIVETAVELVDAQYGALGVLSPDGRLEQLVQVGMSEAEVAAVGHLPRGLGLVGALRMIDGRSDCGIWPTIPAPWVSRRDIRRWTAFSVCRFRCAAPPTGICT